MQHSGHSRQASSHRTRTGAEWIQHAEQSTGETAPTGQMGVIGALQQLKCGVVVVAHAARHALLAHSQQRRRVSPSSPLHTAGPLAEARPRTAAYCCNCRPPAIFGGIRKAAELPRHGIRIHGTVCPERHRCVYVVPPSRAAPTQPAVRSAATRTYCCCCCYADSLSPRRHHHQQQHMRNTRPPPASSSHTSSSHSNYHPRPPSTLPPARCLSAAPQSPFKHPRQPSTRGNPRLLAPLPLPLACISQSHYHPHAFPSAYKHTRRLKRIPPLLAYNPAYSQHLLELPAYS